MTASSDELAEVTTAELSGLEPFTDGESMAFKATTLRVLIASPSDMPEERQVATDAMNDWNALNATAEHVVLLPVRWETHVSPAAGKRPQEIINEQIVRQSDLLLGMFWTKLGSSTGVAELSALSWVMGSEWSESLDT